MRNSSHNWKTRMQAWFKRRSTRVEINQGVLVGHTGSRELHADIYLPPQPLATRPAVLLIHGGGWRMGDRRQLAGIAIRLGLRGYLGVTCEYRLSDEARWPAQIHDVKTTLRWMHANANELAIDPARIGVLGNSAGGHLALLAAGTPNIKEFEGDGGHSEMNADVAAAISFYGPTELSRSSPLWSSVEALLGADTSDEAAWAASPLHYVSEAFPPTLFMHGAEDEIVPVDDSMRMHDELQKHKVPSELHIYAGQPHAYDWARNFGAQSTEIVTLFLDRYLAGVTPLDAPEVRERIAAMHNESQKQETE